MASSNGVSLPPDENRGPEILAICGTLVALSVLIVGLRIWVRARMIGQVGIDDWTIIAATVCVSPQRCRPAVLPNPDTRRSFLWR